MNNARITQRFENNVSRGCRIFASRKRDNNILPREACSGSSNKLVSLFFHSVKVVLIRRYESIDSFKKEGGIIRWLSLIQFLSNLVRIRFREHFQGERSGLAVDIVTVGLSPNRRVCKVVNGLVKKNFNKEAFFRKHWTQIDCQIFCFPPTEWTISFVGLFGLLDNQCH